MEKWLVQAFLAVLFLAPCYMGIGFFKRNLGVQPDLYLLLFLLGSAIGVVALGDLSLPKAGGTARVALVLFAVLGVGILAGSWANLLGFRAVEAAGSSAGQAVAILNSTSLLIYFLLFPLSWLLPRWFEQARFQFHHFFGILMIVAGVGLLALKR